MKAKVYQPLVTPVGTNEQTGVGQATVTTTTSFTQRGLAAGADKALFVLNVSAASGTTPSLTVDIEGWEPGSGKWVKIDSFPAQTGVTTDPVTVAVDPLYFQSVRLTANVSGSSPSFTFSAGAFFIGDDR